MTSSKWIESNDKGNQKSAFSPGNGRLEYFYWKLLMLTALVYFIWNDRIHIQLGPLAIDAADAAQLENSHLSPLGLLNGERSGQNIGFRLPDGKFSNTTFLIDPGFAQRNNIADSVVAASFDQCRNFVRRFNAVAIAEMRQFHIPASILLAQAMLASDAGASPCATEANNYFNQICHNAGCINDHCRISDGPNQNVRVDKFNTLWGSFRAQSLEMRRSRTLDPLFSGEQKSYKTWAAVLGKTCKKDETGYTEKLVALIEHLHLDYFDQKTQA